MFNVINCAVINLNLTYIHDDLNKVCSDYSLSSNIRNDGRYAHFWFSLISIYFISNASIFKVQCTLFSKLDSGKIINIMKIRQNSADPYEMTPYAELHLGLHCLPKYPFTSTCIQNVLRVNIHN